MTAIESRPAGKGSIIEISGVAIAWFLVGGAFLALRAGAIWHAPVAGSEFAHLSGAWNAVAGVDDVRFVPTLFQALSAALLNVEAQEAWPRLLSFLATCSVPFAVFRMRTFLGEGPALVLLLLLGLSANLVVLGATASAYGFDLPVAVWTLLALVSNRAPVGAVAALAFLVATAGPLPAVIVLAYGIVRLARADYPTVQSLGAIAGGALSGIVLASLGFGWGTQGLTVPPIEALASSLEQEYVSAELWEIFVLYTWPIALAGVAGATYFVWMRGEPRETRSGKQWRHLSLASFAVAVLWSLAAARAGTELPLAALALSSAMVAAVPGARLIEAVLAADWRRAALPLGLALFFLAIASVVLIDWARFDSGGPAGQLLLSLALVVGGLALLWALLMQTPMRDSLETYRGSAVAFVREGWDGDWRNAALLVVGVLIVFAVVAFLAVNWASNDATGRRGEAVVLATLLLLAAAILAVMFAMPRLRAAAAVLPIALSLVPVVSGAVLAGIGGPSEPLHSPVSTFQARNLREIALSLVAEQGGTIVVHESLRDDATWPFRDSGDIVIASGVRDGATIVIWPLSLPAPPGMSELPGPWSLTRTVPAPTSSFLRYVRWYADRNYLPMNAQQIAVYSRSGQ